MPAPAGQAPDGDHRAVTVAYRDSTGGRGQVEVVPSYARDADGTTDGRLLAEWVRSTLGPGEDLGNVSSTGRRLTFEIDRHGHDDVAGGSYVTAWVVNPPSP